MRRSIFPLASLLALGAISPSAAAFAITVTEPSDPIPFEGPTTLDVRIDATCQEIINDNPSDNPMQLDVIAAPTVPWVLAVGGKADWTRAQCDYGTTTMKATCSPQPDCQSSYPTASTNATITLTPTNIAPSLELAQVGVSVRNKVGFATANFSVAHYGTLNASADRTTVPAGLGDARDLNVTLDVNANAVSLAVFNITRGPRFGALEGASEPVRLEPHISLYQEHHAGFFVWTDGGPEAGTPLSLVIPLRYVSSAVVWPEDDLTVEIVMQAEKDPSLATEPVSLTWSFQPTVTKAPQESPAPGAALLVAAATGLLLVRARLRRQ